MHSNLYNSVVGTDEQINLEKFRREVIHGLSLNPKRLSSKYLYDEVGDGLFQQIMAMPEYYPTRCEMDIFSNRTADLAALIRNGDQAFDLIELGAGDGLKSSYLLNFLHQQGVEFSYLPIDISAHILSQQEEKLRAELPGIDIHPISGEYFDGLKRASTHSTRSKVVLFLGGNIGNMEIVETQAFCRELRRHLSPGDKTLIGFDLKKNPNTILSAYNDETGITAAFNLNLLSRIRRQLGADIQPEQFQHYQTYDPLSGACRSFLVSLRNQSVRLDPHTFDFKEHEVISVEISQKFAGEEITALASASGFELIDNLVDSKGWFVDSVWLTK
jgi:L-histidine N-alpha-methyltransferase